MSRSINMFIIYAREDKEVERRLLAHLNPFVKALNLNIWHDDHIEAGQEWRPHITSRLNKTDVFLLLVSIDFMNSEFITKVEFKYAVQRHKENQSILIPIIVNYCQWDIDTIFDDDSRFNLSELQVLPDQAVPIDGWKTPEQAYNNIAAGVRKVLTSIKIKLAEQEIQENTKDNSPFPISQQLTPQLVENQEEIEWNKADEEKTAEAYYSYLNKYPNGIYKTAALRAVRILENLSIRKHKNEIEEALWKTACNRNTISSYKEYLDKTESVLYKEQANELIQNIEKENREKKEESSWQKTSKENSIPIYETYLQNYPEGKYVANATKAIKNLEAAMEEDFLWRDTLKENTYASYKLYLRQATLGRHREEAQKFIERFEDLERKEKEETIFWNHVVQNNSIDSYKKYQVRYPNGKYSEQALSALKEIEEIEYEENLWSKANKELTISSYNNYIDKSRLKKHLEEANKNIQHLLTEQLYKKKKEEDLWQEMKRANSIETFGYYLKEYPQGKYKEEALNSIKKLEIINHQQSLDTLTQNTQEYEKQKNELHEDDYNIVLEDNIKNLDVNTRRKSRLYLLYLMVGTVILAIIWVIVEFSKSGSEKRSSLINDSTAISNNPLDSVTTSADTMYNQGFSTQQSTIDTINQEGGQTDTKVVTPPIEEKGSSTVEVNKVTEDYDKEFKTVQIQAKFPGGPDAWAKYLQHNMWSDAPTENGAPPGAYTVVVSFLVDKDGNISEVKAENDPGYGTAEEAVRVIRRGPSWIPAMQNGRKVTYRQKQAITFRVE